MAKPVFVLLHGAWHSPQCWSRLIAELDKSGYSSVAPALPSSGSEPPLPNWDEDVKVIYNTVSELVDQDHEVVVVMHSFSGMTGGTALEGLDLETRKSKGLKGGVVKLIYVMAFLVPEKFQHSPHGTRDNMVPEMQTDLEAGIITVRPEDSKNMFYQDLDDDTVTELTKDLRTQSFGAFWSETTYASWRYIPTTYLLCTQDKPSTVAAAQYLISTAQASGQHKIENVIKIDAGHSPFISKPEQTAQIFIEEAGGKS